MNDSSKVKYPFEEFSLGQWWIGELATISSLGVPSKDAVRAVATALQFTNSAFEEVDRLRAELTKARELLESVPSPDITIYWKAWKTKVRQYIAHQSAPAWPKHPPTAGDFAAFNDDNDFDKRDEFAPAAKVERVEGCADAAWLLFDLGHYDAHGCKVLDAAAIISKAKAYAGYAPAGGAEDETTS